MSLFGSTHHGHFCGIYYKLPNNFTRQYLPQVKVDSHTTLTPVSFTTRLNQTFHNPNKDSALKEVRYTFPLYDGVAVNSYTISYADKQLTGVVKQKDDAKQTYQEAVDRGETAGLLESLPAGVFGVTLGNVPPDTDILVDIQYCGELKHDAGIDGLRYTLPTSIAPRYGALPGEVQGSALWLKDGIQITVDAEMGKSAIRKVQSPSHPISVSMGTTSSQAQDAAFNASAASATLALGAAGLAQDFILQLVIDNISQPQAILETHPTLPGQRSVMATLVPKFTLPPANPEIVFIADQSGSMQGAKNISLVSALKVFLKSLPLGVRFNIIPFGSSFKSLWPTSQAYNETNVKQALDFVGSFQAHYGGTELLQPVKAAFENRLKDMPLEVMLLTDGEIWGEDELFSFVNSQIRGTEKNGPVDARVFALGIGGDVSHTLVEGVARAGNGFAQFVADGEDASAKVIRMLKGALYAHTKDYSMEVNYGGSPTKDVQAEEDDFELVERVDEALNVHDAPAPPTTAAPKSFFDESTDLDKPVEKSKDRYSHLPTIDIPKLLQAPADLPPLYPFNRTTAYLLLGPETSQKPVTSITIRARSADGPLELTVPVNDVGHGTTVHQLAARKAMQDLEQGRGWLEKAKSDGALLKEKHKSRFDELVEREAVRIGVQFQVAGKWTSFVAVEKGKENDAVPDQEQDDTAAFKPGVARKKRAMGAPMFARSAVFASAVPPPPPAPAPSGGGGLFGSASSYGTACITSSSNSSPAAPAGLAQSLSSSASALFGGGGSRERRFFRSPAKSEKKRESAESARSGLFGNSQSLFGAPRPSPQPAVSASPFADIAVDEQESKATEDGLDQSKSGLVLPTFGIMNQLIDLQQFFGCWPLTDEFTGLLHLSPEKILAYRTYLAKNWAELDGAKAMSQALAATAFALAWLENNCSDKKEIWEMVGDKGRDWMGRALNNDRVEEALAEGLRLL